MKVSFRINDHIEHTCREIEDTIARKKEAVLKQMVHAFKKSAALITCTKLRKVRYTPFLCGCAC